jgi:hypothetical protein
LIVTRNPLNLSADSATRRSPVERFHKNVSAHSPHADRHSAVSADTTNVLGRADIGYGNRLRGKRGLDQNYDAMWLLPQKKKYTGQKIRDIPQRIYLDNEMMFKRQADTADFHAPYRSAAM